MHKAYLSILLLFVSLVINSLVSSTYIPLHEGARNKRRKGNKTSSSKNKGKNKNSRSNKSKTKTTKVKKMAVEVIATVKNIINDSIPPENKVHLIKSFIMQQ